MYRPVTAGNESTECVLAAGLGGAGDRHRCLGTMGAHRVYGGAPTLPARLLPVAVTTVTATHPSCRTAAASRYDRYIPPTLLVELLPLCAGQEEGDGHAPAPANRAVVGGLPPVPAAARNGRCNGQPTAMTRIHRPYPPDTIHLLGLAVGVAMSSVVLSAAAAGWSTNPLL